MTAPASPPKPSAQPLAWSPIVECPFCSDTGLRGRLGFDSKTGRYYHDYVTCGCQRRTIVGP